MVTTDREDEDYEDDEDAFDESFEPVSITTAPVSRKKRVVGLPITTDEKLEGLSGLQHDVVESFVQTAKELA